MKKYIALCFVIIICMTLISGCGKEDSVSSKQGVDLVSVDEMAKVLDNLFDKDTSVVVQMLGEPDAKSNPTAEDNDIWSHTIWQYNDECITVEFVDRGSGYVVSRATATKGCPWGTSMGINIGATEAQVRQTYGDLVNEEYSFPEMQTVVVGQPSNCIMFYFVDEVVDSIVVGEMG